MGLVRSVNPVLTATEPAVAGRNPHQARWSHIMDIPTEPADLPGEEAVNHWPLAGHGLALMAGLGGAGKEER